MTATFVYITAKDQDEALRIGRVLVAERLAACANVIENMTSLYWWEDAVQENREAVLIAKTKQSLVNAVIERVQSLHSYDCPCIVAWPIEQGNEEYLNWIDQETRSGTRAETRMLPLECASRTPENN